MIKNVIVNDQYTEVVSASGGGGLANLGIYFCNTSDSSEIIDVFVNGSGNTPSDLTKVVTQLTIPSKETFMFGGEKFLLSPGESIGATSVVGGRVAATVTYTDL
jgi:hypothetical protein